MTESAILAEIRLVLDMLLQQPEQRLAQDALNDLLEARRQFLAAATSVAWERCVVAARQLESHLKPKPSPGARVGAPDAVEYGEMQKRKALRRTKIRFDPGRPPSQ
ncbi:MAG: hypothetical protein ACRDQ2_18085 [Gaiellales bacterium]